MPTIEGVNKLCDGCLIGKQRRTPFPSQASYHVGEPLELVHGDICGSIKSVTPGGKTLFLLVNDKNRFMWRVGDRATGQRLYIMELEIEQSVSLSARIEEVSCRWCMVCWQLKA